MKSKREQKAAKCSDHHKISLIAHATKTVARMLRRWVERKIEDVLGEDQFGFIRGKGTGDAMLILRLISERILDIEEELCACFIDWQKEFDRVNWNK